VSHSEAARAGRITTRDRGATPWIRRRIIRFGLVRRLVSGMVTSLFPRVPLISAVLRCEFS
jgi:hypothetical protein